MDIFPLGAPKPEEILIDSKALPWREKSLKGVSEKMLWRNPQTGASIALIRFAQGAGIPSPHYHPSNQFMICLSGRYEYTQTGVVLTARQLLLQSERQCARTGHRTRRNRRDRDLRRTSLRGETGLVHRRAGRPVAPETTWPCPRSRSHRKKSVDRAAIFPKPRWSRPA